MFTSHTHERAINKEHFQDKSDNHLNVTKNLKFEILGANCNSNNYGIYSLKICYHVFYSN